MYEQPCLFELPYLTLGNLSDEEVQIGAELLIFSCKIGHDSDHIVLNKAPADLLKQSQFQINERDSFSGLENLGRVVSRFMNITVNAVKMCQCPQWPAVMQFSLPLTNC